MCVSWSITGKWKNMSWVKKKQSERASLYCLIAKTQRNQKWLKKKQWKSSDKYAQLTMYDYFSYSKL